jgi:CubicO group peptidase (beta-lactamase class C family)
MTTDQTAQFIKDKMNAGEFPAIYAVLSQEFQKQVPATDFEQFSGGLMQAMGKIQSIKPQKPNEYIVKGDKKTFKMHLYVDKGKIEGLQFLPYSEKLKEKSITSNPLQTDLDKQIDAFASPFMQQAATMGMSIGIIRDGKTYFYNYGETQKGNKTLPTQNTLFEIGSISKTFTGSLLALAVLEKKISLDDEINKYLPKDIPKMVFNGKPIRIKHLSNHTSGLPRMPEDFFQLKGFDEQNPYKNYTDKELFEYLKKLKLTREPEKQLEYSNLGVGLLGVILERVYKKSYEELIKEKIALPLEMKDTHLKTSENQFTRFAKGYNEANEINSNWDFQALAAAGAIRSTVSDMLLYTQAQISTNKQNLQNAFNLAQTTTYSAKEEIGLGWFKMKKDANTIFWHNGGTGGYRSFMAFDKNKKVGVVILTNASEGPDNVGIQMMEWLLKN